MKRCAGIALGVVMLVSVGCRTGGGAAGVELGDAGDNSQVGGDGGMNMTDPDGGAASGSSSGGASGASSNNNSTGSGAAGGSSGAAGSSNNSAANSAASSSSSSSGGSSSQMGTACVSSRDCNTREVCISALCVPGCMTANDCGLNEQCNTALGPHGTCVDCLSASDCQGTGALCDMGTCRVGCNSAGQCPFPLTCRMDNVCVRCIDDAVCGPGRICEANDCVQGCRMDAQCRPGQVCSANQCVTGCHATPNTCPVGSICHEAPGTAGQCQSGCNVAADCGATGFQCTGNQCVRTCNVDTDCPDGSICSAGACAAGCRPPTRGCLRGSYCDSTASGVAGACLPGCDDALDCQGQIQNVCNTTTHACVECLMNSDCSFGGNGPPATCNASNQCDITCDPMTMLDRCQLLPGFQCSQTLMPPVCVQCDTTMDCDNFETCSNNRCVGTSSRPFCAPCDADAQCGGNGALCVLRNMEQVCGSDCGAGQTCPGGTQCLQVGGQNGTVPRGHQCLPANSVQQFASCAAYNDLIDQTMCAGGQDCGRAGFLGANGDAICSGAGASMGMCSVLCTVGGNDCPAGFICEDPPDTPTRVFAPRCAHL